MLHSTLFSKFVSKTSSNLSKCLSTAKPKVESTLVVAQQYNIKQSPLKMKFLVGLIRNAWVPDAFAQLKFSPRHRAVDVAKILNVRFVV